jgi:hypothetical protein
MNEEIITLANKIKEYKSVVLSEEATKMAFILPFISMLGYDVFNPTEVIPEVECDISKRSDRIDYAVFIDRKPAFLVECKAAGISLNGYVNQAAKYFVASRARFIILTNGIDYWFFTDLKDRNLMDEKPFFTINLLNANYRDMKFMEKFSRDNFNESALSQSARIVSHRQELRDEINSILSSPSDDFIRMVVSKFYDGVITKSVIDEFAPLVCEAISDFAGRDNVLPNTVVSREQDQVMKDISDAFDIIKSIILDFDNSQEVVYKVFKTNVRIAILNKWHYVCKLDFTDSRKRIGFPVGDYKHIEWVTISDISEIYSLTDYIQNGVRVAKNHLSQYV